MNVVHFDWPLITDLMFFVVLFGISGRLFQSIVIIDAKYLVSDGKFVNVSTLFFHVILDTLRTPSTAQVETHSPSPLTPCNRPTEDFLFEVNHPLPCVMSVRSDALVGPLYVHTSLITCSVQRVF